jgi:mobilization protein NikA
MSPYPINSNHPIQKLLNYLDLSELCSMTRRSERFNLRVTPFEKKGMESVARELGLSVTEYLTGLHHFAMEKLAVEMEAPTPLSGGGR